MKQSEWISVEDRFPKNRGYYLCYLSDANGENICRVSFLICEKDGFAKNHKFDGPVTHWMPLPEPPECPL